jgi:hypothetical protein
MATSESGSRPITTGRRVLPSGLFRQPLEPKATHEECRILGRSGWNVWQLGGDHAGRCQALVNHVDF